mmetsp:Transcript_29953/g.60422  ORF Transcript_29953/g.60422 Transcript_29953/m.60422 type:complete len:204 (+) Transcript_29953:62-673(+)
MMAANHLRQEAARGDPLRSDGYQVLAPMNEVDASRNDEEKGISLRWGCGNVKLTGLTIAIALGVLVGYGLAGLTDDRGKRPSLAKVQEELAALHLPVHEANHAVSTHQAQPSLKPQLHFPAQANQASPPVSSSSPTTATTTSSLSHQSTQSSSKQAHSQLVQVRLPAGVKVGEEVEAEVAGHGVQKFVVPPSAAPGELVTIRV